MSNFTDSDQTNGTLSLANNPFSDNLIIWIYNENFYKNINLPCVVYLCILASVGIFGNSLVVYIYGFRFRRSNSHFFILSLGILDLVFSTAMILEVFDKRFPMYSGNYRILCKITRLIDVFLTASSSLLLLCIALDRYYKICKPFYPFTYHKAIKCLIVCVGIGVVLSWPIVLFHGPKTIETGVKNVVGSDCSDDDAFKDSVYPSIYFGFLGVLNIIVFLLLAGMYIRIFRAISKWKKEPVGDTIHSSPTSMVTTEFKFSRVAEWINRAKHKLYHESSTDSIYNAVNGDSISMHHMPSEESQPMAVHNGVNGSNQRNSIINNGNRRHHKRQSVFSVSSGPVSLNSLKHSKVVTTNTIAFALVTVVYIISYLPTIFVEILNAGGAYTDVDLTIETRRLIVVLNAAYFFNNVCNIFIYSAINPAFRDEVKQLITGK